MEIYARIVNLNLRFLAAGISELKGKKSRMIFQCFLSFSTYLPICSFQQNVIFSLHLFRVERVFFWFCNRTAGRWKIDRELKNFPEVFPFKSTRNQKETFIFPFHPVRKILYIYFTVTRNYSRQAVATSTWNIKHLEISHEERYGNCTPSKFSFHQILKSSK